MIYRFTKNESRRGENPEFQNPRLTWEGGAEPLLRTDPNLSMKWGNQTIYGVFFPSQSGRAINFEVSSVRFQKKYTWRFPIDLRDCVTGTLLHKVVAREIIKYDNKIFSIQANRIVGFLEN